MTFNHLKKRWQNRHQGVIHVLLVLAMLFFLGHESQHDLPTVADVDAKQCEFCLNGTGPLGVATSELSAFASTYEYFFRHHLFTSFPQSFLGFSYTSRALPAV